MLSAPLFKWMSRMSMGQANPHLSPPRTSPEVPAWMGCGTVQNVPHIKKDYIEQCVLWSTAISHVCVHNTIKTFLYNRHVLVGSRRYPTSRTSDSKDVELSTITMSIDLRVVSCWWWPCLVTSGNNYLVHLNSNQLSNPKPTSLISVHANSMSTN